MAGKHKFTRALWQEWQRDPKATAEKWGINWVEWEQSVGKHQNWSKMSYEQFEDLMKKSRWGGIWDWTA